MAWFLVRVILHEANTWEEYGALHDAMEAKGFERVITGDKGNTYHLPPAEYFREASLTPQQVRDDASDAANSVKRRFGVIVAEATRFSWTGLDRVDPDANDKG